MLLIDAVTLTAHSGRLVPIATIVSPIIIDGTLNLLATDELPSTKKSAPFIRSTKPITSNTNATKISFIKTKANYFCAFFCVCSFIVLNIIQLCLHYKDLSFVIHLNISK